MKKYDYSFKYIEKDNKVKFRRCRFCEDLVSVSKLETKSCCETCFTIIHKKKRCKKCRLRKDIVNFSKNKTYKDGFVSKCMDCNPRNVNKQKQKQATARYRDRKKGKIGSLVFKNEEKSIYYRKNYRKICVKNQQLRDNILKNLEKRKKNINIT